MKSRAEFAEFFKILGRRLWIDVVKTPIHFGRRRWRVMAVTAAIAFVTAIICIFFVPKQSRKVQGLEHASMPKSLTVIPSPEPDVRKKMSEIQISQIPPLPLSQTSQAIAPRAEASVGGIDEMPSVDTLVRKGEGEEHPMIRQLMANPGLITEKKFAYKGDATNRVALHHWAGRIAHLIATGTGYWDWRFYREARILVPDKISIRLVRTAKGFEVIESKVTKGTDGTIVSCRRLAKRSVMIEASISPRHAHKFLGASLENHSVDVPTYFYVFYSDKSGP